MTILRAAAAGITSPKIELPSKTFKNLSGGGSFEVRSSGDYFASGFDAGDWITPKRVAPGAFEVRATLNSGSSLLTGTTGSWLALTSDRSWTNDTGASSNLTIEIRDGAGLVRATGTIIIEGQFA